MGFGFVTNIVASGDEQKHMENGYIVMSHSPSFWDDCNRFIDLTVTDVRKGEDGYVPLKWMANFWFQSTGEQDARLLIPIRPQGSRMPQDVHVLLPSFGQPPKLG